ncbi:uncharacterized protein LOC117898333 [Drosophila subobscura]|uniref:uncharacterized protein LOC117898333 n=1 Tax=Drosophila subobscura TaxID=7241 RepID=UPI00155AFFF0|nr:uncharacterized protein LOC117898333 [Drosophila subobscura]
MDASLARILIACSFRTVSDEAALVIAGKVPLRELVREKQEIRTAVQGGSEATKAELKATARRNSINRWQVDFYLTQALSGHGCFRSYLKRFGHETEDWCPACGNGIVEDAQHVFFECHRFDHERLGLEAEVGARISTGTLVPTILAEPRAWEARKQRGGVGSKFSYPLPGRQLFEDRLLV